MFNGSIFCLLVSNVSLSSADRTVLYETGCEMYKKGSKKKRIKTDSLEGRVASDFMYRALPGNFGGVKFIANIETNLGTGLVEYVIQNFDLECALKEGEWVEVFDEGPSSSAQWN
jgi:hypothetical protein